MSQKLLIIEDEEGIIHLLNLYLRDVGYDVFIASMLLYQQRILSVKRAKSRDKFIETQLLKCVGSACFAVNFSVRC